MTPSPRVRVLNWLADRPWISDERWWRLNDLDRCLDRWRSPAAPDGRVWLDVRPALALAVSRRATRITQRLHVRTDPTCQLGRHVPRSRVLDVASRAYACPACASQRRGREVLEQLRGYTLRLADEMSSLSTREGLRQHAEDVVQRYRREQDLGPSTAQQLRELVPTIYSHDPERAEVLLRRAADELDALHARP